MLQPGELGGGARRHREDEAGEGFEDELLRAVGQHRHEEEHREAARGRLRPDTGQHLEEGLAFGTLVRGGGRPGRLDATHRQHRNAEGDERDRARHGHEAQAGERIEEMTGQGRRDREACDHHDPDQGGGRPPPPGVDAGGEQHEEGRPGRSGPHADAEEGEDRQRKTGGDMRFHHGSGECSQEAAERQGGHATDDPGRAAPADIRAVAPARTQDLDGVMKGDETTGDHGGQRQFHHHHAVEGRGHQHDDGAQSRLDEAEPRDRRPGERDGRGHGLVSVLGAKAEAPKTPGHVTGIGRSKSGRAQVRAIPDAKFLHSHVSSKIYSRAAGGVDTAAAQSSSSGPSATSRSPIP